MTDLSHAAPSSPASRRRRSTRRPGTPRVVLVTGASSGFGRAIAAAAQQAGHRVYGTSRHPRSTQESLPMLTLDVRSDDSVQRCVDDLLAREGRLDVLVNNAGVGLAGALEDTATDEAVWQMDTNVFGVLRMTRAVLPVMRGQGCGRIITVSSLAGLTGMAYQPVYAASKHAVEGLVSSLRLELADSPIDACTVAPGDFRTGFTSSRVVAAGARSDVHAERFERTMAIYERDEQNGPHPRVVGDLVARLVDAPRLRPRYLVGKPSQRAPLMLKNAMPAEVFEYLMTLVYGLR
jgi:NAD(P)-dependent dehydrogenase (short-subunit alcohol dehydrogenase family)